MAFRTTELGVMVKLNPERACKVLLAEHRRHGGNTTRVSEALEVNVATVKRWIAALEIRMPIEEMRTKEAAKRRRTAERARKAEARARKAEAAG